MDSSYLWYTVAFILFVVGVFRPAKKFILQGLDGYSQRINERLNEAKNLREEAQTLLASYKRKQRDAAIEAEELLQRTKQEAENLRKQKLAEMEIDLRKREQQVLDKIAVAEEQTTQEIKNLAAQLVIEVLQNLARSNQAAIAPVYIDQGIKQIPHYLGTAPAKKAA